MKQTNWSFLKSPEVEFAGNFFVDVPIVPVAPRLKKQKPISQPSAGNPKH